VVRDAVPAAPLAPVPSAPVVPLVESSVDARTVAFPKSEEPSFEPPADRVLSPLELQEYQLIARVLREERGGIRRAALRLGLTHQALLRRLQKWPELRPAQAS
jgi:DNA-binding NtrC family response regulator